jgi:hypothetical protein
MLMTEVDADVTTRAVVRLLLTLVLTLSAFDNVQVREDRPTIQRWPDTPQRSGHRARISDKASEVTIPGAQHFSYSHMDRLDEAFASDDLNSALGAILRSSPGGGSYTERQTLPTGEVVVHRFALATGFAAHGFAKTYRDRFGVLPGWVVTCHPGHRYGLCKWALQNGTPLPDSAPKC